MITISDSVVVCCMARRVWAKLYFHSLFLEIGKTSLRKRDTRSGLLVRASTFRYILMWLRGTTGRSCSSWRRPAREEKRWSGRCPRREVSVTVCAAIWQEKNIFRGKRWMIYMQLPTYITNAWSWPCVCAREIQVTDGRTCVESVQSSTEIPAGCKTTVRNSPNIPVLLGSL